MIEPGRFSGSRPRLEQDDLEEDVAILTIATVEEVNVKQDDGGERPSLVCTFDETEDKALWLNVTQIKALVQMLGNDEKKWPGCKVPVERHEAEFRGKTYHKVRVMLADEWQGIFKEAGIRFPYSASEAPRERKVAAPAAGVKRRGGRRRKK